MSGSVFLLCVILISTVFRFISHDNFANDLCYGCCCC